MGLENLSVTELRQFIAFYNLHVKIRYYAKMKKDELIGELNKHIVLQGDKYYVRQDTEHLDFILGKSGKNIKKQKTQQNQIANDQQYEDARSKTQEEVVIKKPQPSYNENFFYLFDEIYSGKIKYRQIPTKATDEEKKLVDFNNHLIKTLMNAQGVRTKKDVWAWDLYVSPKEVVKQLLDDDIEDLKGMKLSILEPSVGTCSILRYLIDKFNGYIERCDAVENHQGLYEVIKPYLKNVGYFHEDFLEYEPKNNNYNLIVMNPPFKGYLPEKLQIKNNTRYDKIYLYHILKAVHLLITSKCRHEKYLYIISPKFHTKSYIEPNDFYDKFPTDRKKSLLSAFANVTVEKGESVDDAFEDAFTVSQIDFIGEFADFKQINEMGYITNLNMKVYLYKFLIPYSN